MDSGLCVANDRAVTVKGVTKPLYRSHSLEYAPGIQGTLSVHPNNNHKQLAFFDATHRSVRLLLRTQDLP